MLSGVARAEASVLAVVAAEDGGGYGKGPGFN